MQDLIMKYVDVNHPLYNNLNVLGLPNSKTEQYKKFPIKKILSREYTYENKSKDEMLLGTRLVIENGFVKEFPGGVKVSYSQDFLVDLKHYDSLYFLSHIVASRVIYIEVNESLNFEIEHRCMDRKNLFSYRVVVKTSDNLDIQIYESFVTQNSENSFLLYGIDMEIAQHSTVTWIRNEKIDENQVTVVGTHNYSIASYGALELKTFDLGSANTLHLYKIDLSSYAWVDASHLLLADKNSKRGNVVVINHNDTYAKSVQEARTIISDEATGVFDAKICVNSEAKYSNVSQNSKAILLDTNSQMYAKPQLEIYTDELEASHGSTIGSLDEEALFYLCSRGIILEEARKILVSSFANTLINRVQNQQYVEQIRNDFNEAYYVKDTL